MSPLEVHVCWKCGPVQRRWEARALWGDWVTRVVPPRGKDALRELKNELCRVYLFSSAADALYHVVGQQNILAADAAAVLLDFTDRHTVRYTASSIYKPSGLMYLVIATTDGLTHGLGWLPV